jgi:FKBP-type peptidyl-prolyl cis-trans isomerase FklB
VQLAETIIDSYPFGRVSRRRFLKLTVFFVNMLPRKGIDMKQLSLALAGTLGILLLASGCTAEEKKLELKDLKDKVSYCIGLNIGKDFKNKEVEVNPDILAQGIKDALSEGKTLLTEEQIKETLTAFQNEMIAKQESRLKELAEKNRKEGEAFLAENEKKEGVVTLPSGLQYKILEEGAGKTPKSTDTVTVHYRGTLIDGREFDSSYHRGEPATFPVDGVIPGWTEALQLMKEGAKWQLFIPASLAYGEQGVGPAIGPNATLIFDVELIKIK